jgi:protein TonB
MSLDTALDELVLERDPPRRSRVEGARVLVFPARLAEAPAVPLVPFGPRRALTERQALGGGARGLSLVAAILLHAALIAGGLVFDWFGVRETAEELLTAQVTLLPAPKPESAPPLAASPTYRVPPVLMPEPSFAIEAAPSPRAIRLPESASASAARTSYVSRLAAHLARYKRYPPEAWSRREEGEALVRFVVDRAGHVLSFEIVQSAGFAALDQEVAALLARAAPLPPIPDAIAQERLTVILPIGFTLHA